MNPVIAYIALGSNLGDRAENIDAAIDRLCQTDGIEVTRVSSLLENPSVGGPTNAPEYLNAVAEVKTTLSAKQLLDRLLQIEHELGRVRREHNDPRIIDLDVILYGDQVIHEPHLTIPHPRLHERRFVLQPLAEIAPDVVHPVLKQTILVLLDRLK